MVVSAETVPQASSALGPCQSKPYGFQVTLWRTEQGIGYHTHGVLPEGTMIQLRC
jgi:hypothetical protein